jgi:hypothetical protein
MSGCRNASSWAIMPPIDRPRIVARSAPAAWITWAASSARSAIVYGARAVRENPVPRLSIRTTWNRFSSRRTQSDGQTRPLVIHPFRSRTTSPWPPSCQKTCGVRTRLPEAPFRSGCRDASSRSLRAASSRCSRFSDVVLRPTMCEAVRSCISRARVIFASASISKLIVPAHIAFRLTTSRYGIEYGASFSVA